MPDFGIGEAAAAGAAGGAGGGGFLSGLAGLLGLGGADAAAGAAAGAGADAAITGLVPGSLDTLAATGGLSGSLPAATGGIDLAALGGGAAGLFGDVGGAAGSGVSGATQAGTSVASSIPSSGVVGAGPSAAGVSAPAGVSSPLGVDPTAAFGVGDATLPAGAAPIQSTPFVNGAEAVPFTGGANPAGAALGSAAPVAPASAPPTAGGGFLDTLSNSLSPSNIAGGIGKSVASNPLGLALGAGGLGYNILNGQKQTANVKALEDQAARQANTGAQLEGYLTSGTLPPGLKAGVDQAVSSAKANAISNAAKSGQSTDPTQNTALAAQLQAIEAQVPQLTAQIGQQLLTSGISASGLSSSLYTTLANIDQTQTTAIGKSIANMSAALSGKTSIPGTNISVSQTG